MKGIKRFPLAMLAVAALALGGLAGTGDVAYADNEVGGEIKTHQVFETSDTTVAGEFEYCFEAETEGAPMPEGAEGQKYCFTMTGNETNVMQLRASASAPAVSKYTLRLVSPLPEGYTLLSPDAYHYEVYAHPGDGYIILAFNDGAPRIKEEDPAFTVAYKMTPKTPPPSTTPPTTPPPTKPPTSNLVQTGATVTFGAMLVLLLVGGLLLSRRREAE